MDNILSMIKQGVKLRPAKDEKKSAQDQDILETPSDSHMRLLQESLSRISKFTRESSPESEEDSEDEDSFAWLNCSFYHLWYVSNDGFSSFTNILCFIYTIMRREFLFHFFRKESLEPSKARKNENMIYNVSLQRNLTYLWNVWN